MEVRGGDLIGVNIPYNICCCIIMVCVTFPEGVFMQLCSDLSLKSFSWSFVCRWYSQAFCLSGSNSDSPAGFEQAVSLQAIISLSCVSRAFMR